MNEHTTPLIQPQPLAGGDEHQTIIKFVLSGPILGGQAEVAHVAAAPSAEIAELRERVSLLERALAEADSRFEAMQQALSATVAAAAANAIGAASASAHRMAPQPPAPVYAVEAAPEPAPEPEPVRPAADYEPRPAATFEPYAEPAAVTELAPAPEPAPYFAAPAIQPEPVHARFAEPPADNGYTSLLGDSFAPAPQAVPTRETSPLAMAVMPDPEPLSLVTQPAAPALRAPEPGPPKVRGLRRMMAVLKNL